MLEQKCPILAYFCCSAETAAKFIERSALYTLVAHANFQKNSCARIKNKKRNHVLLVGHFKHITNNPSKVQNILSIKLTNIQVLRVLIL